MKVFEVPLHLLYERTNGSQTLTSDDLALAHHILTPLSKDQLLSDVDIDNPLEVLRDNPTEQPQFYLGQLCGYGENESPSLDTPSAQLPLNCDVAFTQAVDGRLGQARELLEYLIQRDAEVDSLDTALIERYEQRQSEFTSEERDITVRAASGTTAEEDALAGRLLRWLETQENDFVFAQQEVPVGIQRSAATLDREITTDRTISEVLKPSGPKKTPKGFWTEAEIAQSFGSGISSGAARGDLVIVRPEAVYVTELKTESQPIQSVSDVYQYLGQSLFYSDCFTEDYPSIAAEQRVIPVLAAKSIRIADEMMKPSFEKHGLTLLDVSKEKWVVHPHDVV
ncbi:hypothetical protein [Haloferax denitrificans]|uniref:hypothetical protein n=1 Tax=Haloferax denitrificans TaxID=35745 RepID=UPI00126920CD|nr:hypothetical protein [Haloferax denitrificans]